MNAELAMHRRTHNAHTWPHTQAMAQSSEIVREDYYAMRWVRAWALPFNFELSDPVHLAIFNDQQG